MQRLHRIQALYLTVVGVVYVLLFIGLLVVGGSPSTWGLMALWLAMLAVFSAKLWHDIHHPQARQGRRVLAPNTQRRTTYLVVALCFFAMVMGGFVAWLANGGG